MAKGPEAFRTISEAAEELDVPQHVLRFWETKFSFIRPMKRAGGRRFYQGERPALDLDAVDAGARPVAGAGAADDLLGLRERLVTAKARLDDLLLRGSEKA